MTTTTSSMPGLTSLGLCFNAFTSSYPFLYSNVTNVVLLSSPKAKSQTVSYNGKSYSLPEGYVLNDAWHGGSGVSETTSATGTSVQSYTSSLAETASLSLKFGGFSGSVDQSYGTSVATSGTTYYTTIIQTIWKYEITLSVADVDLSGNSNSSSPLYVHPNLVAAFSALVPDADGDNALGFFGQWGTHVTTGLSFGGQTSYSMYGSSSSFKSEEDWSLAANAAYAGVSGSTSVEVSTTVSTSNVQSNMSLSVIGGSTAAQALLLDQAGSTAEQKTANYTSWGDSVTGAEAWYGFSTSGGLTPIWELCSDPTKQAYLAAVYNQVVGNTPVSAGSLSSSMSYVKSPGATTDPYYVDIVDSSKLKYGIFWAAGAGEIVVGLGLNLSDHHLTGALIITLNTNDGSYHQYFLAPKGGSLPTSSTKWQAFALAPQGAAITSFGVTDVGGQLGNLVIAYQPIQLGAQGSPAQYLGPVQTLVGSGRSAQTVDLGTLPFGTAWAAKGLGQDISDINRCATVAWPPAGSNQNAIVQFTLDSIKSPSTGNPGFFYLDVGYARLSVAGSADGVASSGE